jgi:hypothetical protein
VVGPPSDPGTLLPWNRGKHKYKPSSEPCGYSQSDNLTRTQIDKRRHGCDGMHFCFRGLLELVLYLHAMPLACLTRLLPLIHFTQAPGLKILKVDSQICPTNIVQYVYSVFGSPLVSIYLYPGSAKIPKFPVSIRIDARIVRYR